MLRLGFVISGGGARRAARGANGAGRRGRGRGDAAELRAGLRALPHRHAGGGRGLRKRSTSLVGFSEGYTGDAAQTCVPGFHKRMDSWLESMPADVDGQKPWSEEDLLAMGPIPVPGNAGDVYAPDPLSDRFCLV